MNKAELIKTIEQFAPPELQEKWDCSGSVVQTSDEEVSKVMLSVTVNEKVVRQAIDKNCTMIISHHPMFFVPFWCKGIEIYCAHTNLDKALGGTTDTLVDRLGFISHPIGDFIRVVDLQEPMSVKELGQKLKKMSPNARVVNNHNCQSISRIAFCAGSGMDCLSEAVEIKADCFVTGDIKYHDAVEADIVLFDIGHFESEKPVLQTIANLINSKVEVYFADEQSPFKAV